MRRLRVLPIALVVALLSVACASTSREGANDTVGGDSRARVAGTEPGSTAAGGPAATSGASTGSGGATSQNGQNVPGGASAAVTSPIKLGIVRTGVSNAEAFGVSLGGTVSESDINKAIIDTFNAKGGIAGRKIVPVYADTDTGSSSWDADFAAACAKFTQDHHVEAVVGYVFNFDPSFESCLAEQGVPHLSTTFNVPDAQELAKYPLLMNLATPRIERRSLLKVDGAIATGQLTKSNKLGVVIDVCPGTERAWNTVTKPYLLRKGITIASVFKVGCPHGQGEAGAEAGRAGNLVLQFRTAGVTRVMVNAVSEGPAIFIIAAAAEAQGWYPRYIVSSLANAAVLSSQMSVRQAANVFGYGWMPTQDVNPAQWPALSASQNRCRQILSGRGIKLSSATDYSYAFNICDALFLYEAGLKANRGRSDGRPMIDSFEALGSSYVSAMTLLGRARFTPTQHDAPSFARYFTWDPGCRCFRYRSPTFPIR